MKPGALYAKDTLFPWIPAHCSRKLSCPQETGSLRVSSVPCQALFLHLDPGLPEGGDQVCSLCPWDSEGGMHESDVPGSLSEAGAGVGKWVGGILILLLAARVIVPALASQPCMGLCCPPSAELAPSGFIIPTWAMGGACFTFPGGRGAAGRRFVCSMRLCGQHF